MVTLLIILLISMSIGAVIGLVPLSLGAKKHQLRRGLFGFLTCVGAGFVLGSGMCVVALSHIGF